MGNAKIEWAQFEADVRTLFTDIKSAGAYRPDILVPLLRGGAAPMLYIAEWWGFKDVRPVNIVREGNGRRIVYPPAGNIGDVAQKNVLLLEDDVPTGGSLLYLKRVLEDRKAMVKVAAVYVNPSTRQFVDFYGRILDPLQDLPWKPTRSGDRLL